MTNPLRPADVSALAKSLSEEAALIEAGRAYLDEVCSHTDREALSPETLMAIGRDVNDPKLLTRPVVLAWAQVYRRHVNLHNYDWEL